MQNYELRSGMCAHIFETTLLARTTGLGAVGGLKVATTNLGGVVLIDGAAGGLWPLVLLEAALGGGGRGLGRSGLATFLTCKCQSGTVPRDVVHYVPTLEKTGCNVISRLCPLTSTSIFEKSTITLNKRVRFG